eukprot:scaffold269489_cov24-Tisochrysis_lutea.AAC.2
MSTTRLGSGLEYKAPAVVENPGRIGTKYDAARKLLARRERTAHFAHAKAARRGSGRGCGENPGGRHVHPLECQCDRAAVAHAHLLHLRLACVRGKHHSRHA